MKNFKKVISAVIALAMVISSFTAVSASKFADVADTANYAEAVEVLAALGIVNGTEEEGTLVFKPENQVTRAEAATMIVGALNMADDAKASAGTSQFADVNTQAAWAAGYVNVGVAQGFIKGYDASTFGPLDNVTYAQMCVMLTSIAGYGEYAAANGGWPTGYTNMAAATGMNKGVAAAADAALTKGQVAQMVYNTLVTPKLGVAEYALTGNTYSQLDGKNGRDYQTLLSEKFEGYVATVTIDATPVSAGLENDEVQFIVTKCDWWPETEEPATSNDTVDTDSLVAADVDVNGNYLQTGKAVFVTNEDDELVMIYFASTGKTETKELAADTYVPQAKLSSANKFADDNKKLRFGSTYYKMDDEIVIYVNGTEYATVEADDASTYAYLDALIYKAQGTVKLVKADDSNYYNKIFVDYYQIAKVVAVDVEDDETVVTLSNTKEVIIDGDEFDEIVISTDAVEEGNTIVTVTKNGAKAELADLKKGDIIGYAVDFANVTDLEDPKVIDIVATNDTASGTVTKVNTDDNKYTIGGTVYEKLAGVAAIELKDSLVLTLDPFGRIFATETDGTSAKYAIVLNVTSNDQVKLLLADGTQKTYEVTNSVDLGEIEDTIDAANGDVTALVAKYTVKGSTGELNSVEFVTGTSLGVDGTEYKARTGKLGNNTIASTTPIIDATKVETARDAKTAASYSVVAKDALIDGTNYHGIVIKDNTYVAFVLLTEVGTTFGESTRFAVVQQAAEEHFTDDDDECELVTVLYNGKAGEELLFVPGVYEDAELAVGDAFFFETDADGFVETVYVIDEDIADTLDGLIETGTDGWSWNIWDEGYDIQLAKAAVIEVTDKTITFASLDQVATGALDTNVDLDDTQADGIVTYAIADDAVAYTYDADSDEYLESRKYKAKAASSVKASNLDRYEDEDDDGVFAGIDMDDVNEALVMIVDGDVVAMYVIEK